MLCSQPGVAPPFSSAGRPDDMFAGGGKGRGAGGGRNEYDPFVASPPSGSARTSPPLTDTRDRPGPRRLLHDRCVRCIGGVRSGWLPCVVRYGSDDMFRWCFFQRFPCCVMYIVACGCVPSLPQSIGGQRVGFVSGGRGGGGRRWRRGGLNVHLAQPDFWLPLR